MKKTWYNLLVGITLTLPMTVYLVLAATVFQIKAQAIVYGKTEQVEVVEDEFLYAHALTEEIRFNGNVEWHNGEYALRFEKSDIIKFDNGYFTFDENWVDVKTFELKKQQSYKAPLSIIFSGLGVLIVALVISGKMEFHKKFPRVATLVSLGLGTLILTGISLIVNNLADVFLIATLSWAVYMIEHAIYKGVVSGEKVKEIKSVLDNELDDALKGLK